MYLGTSAFHDAEGRRHAGCARVAFGGIIQAIDGRLIRSEDEGPYVSTVMAMDEQRSASK
jgi:hypothetical protein